MLQYLIRLHAQVTTAPTSLPTAQFNSANLQNVTRFILMLAAALAVIYTIIGAVKLTISSGKPEDIATGRRTIIYSIVGLVISVSAFGIISFVQADASRIEGETNPFFGGDGIVTIVVERLGLIVGVASVIMIIVGALRYITSQGQPQSAAAARSTVIYAAIGIVVALLAQALVGFVLNRL